jgi:preprotein translocase subunit Sec63
LSKFSLQRSHFIIYSLKFNRDFHSTNFFLKPKRDYYDILGITKTATKEDIKKKFRELAKKYHPDLNKDDKSAEAKFREVSEVLQL